jgi:hypothetical protein
MLRSRGATYPPVVADSAFLLLTWRTWSGFKNLKVRNMFASSKSCVATQISVTQVRPTGTHRSAAAMGTEQEFASRCYSRAVRMCA